jgi:hypothetical protein
MTLQGQRGADGGPLAKWGRSWLTVLSTDSGRGHRTGRNGAARQRGCAPARECPVRTIEGESATAAGPVYHALSPAKRTTSGAARPERGITFGSAARWSCPTRARAQAEGPYGTFEVVDPDAITRANGDWPNLSIRGLVLTDASTIRAELVGPGSRCHAVSHPSPESLPRSVCMVLANH